MTSLDQLAQHAAERVAAAQQRLSLRELRRQALALPKGGLPLSMPSKSRVFPLSANAKRHPPPRGSLQRIFPICTLPERMKMQERTAFLC